MIVSADIPKSLLAIDMCDKCQTINEVIFIEDVYSINSGIELFDYNEDDIYDREILKIEMYVPDDMVDVECTIEEEEDPAGTGDSPAIYEAKVKSWSIPALEELGMVFYDDGTEEELQRIALEGFES